MEPINLTVKDLKFLENIEPFPEIAEKLNDIIANNNFSQYREPCLEFSDNPAIESDPASETEWNMPSLKIAVLEPTESWSDITFKICISLWNCDQTRQGKAVLDCLYFSRFSRYFAYSGYAEAEVEMKMDVTTAARFMTYYIKVFGYVQPSDFKIEICMWFTCASISELHIPAEVFVPESFRRAVAKVKELQLTYDDWIFMQVSGPCDRETNESLTMHSYIDDEGSMSIWYEGYWKDRDVIERMRSYRNFDCLDVRTESGGYCIDFDVDDSEESLRFITDYFLFHNPDVRNDEIVVSLDFSICRDYKSDGNASNEDSDEDLSELLFSFYPDGSEDSPGKLVRLIDDVEKSRRYDEQRSKEAESMQKHGITPLGYDVDWNAFYETEPSEAILSGYRKLGWYRIGDIGRQDHLRFYDADDRLVMDMSRQDLSGCYYFTPQVKTVCAFYLTQEQKEEFDQLFFADGMQRFEYETDNEEYAEIAVSLPDNSAVISKFVTYWLKAIGYNPDLLFPELIDMATTPL